MATQQRALKATLVVVGLFFTAAIYPVVMILWQKDQPSYETAMGLSLYVTLGVMLLAAAKDPAAHRSVISFAIWSSFAHAAVMTVMVIRDERSRGEWLPVVILVVIAMTLLLVRRSQPGAAQSDATAA